MSVGKLKELNGKPAIFIDGKPYPPMMATIRTTKSGEKRVIDFDYYKNLGKSGIKIFFIICDTLWLNKAGFAEFKEEIETVTKAVPDAYFMLRVGMHPPKEWVEKNEDECVKYSDNKKKKARLYTESFEENYSAMYSLCSQKWREDAGKALLELDDKLSEYTFYDRIVGYFFAAGGTSEWYYITPMEYTTKTNYCDTGGWIQTTDTEYDNVYADIGESFRKEFKIYLKEKYKNEENLKKAWNDKTVTFDNFTIPNCEKRYYVNGVDYDLENPPPLYTSDPTPKPPKNGTNIGCFLDIAKNRDVFDFYRALHNATAKSVIYFGNLIKKKSRGNKLTGAFYGSAGSIKFFSFSQVGAVDKILNSDAIDFLASPGVYENRNPGGFTGQRQVFDSFAINNKMFVVEEDTRTHHEKKYYRSYLDLYDTNDSLNILKREFGRNICENLQAWWFDQIIGGGRYKDKDIYELFKRQEEIATESYRKDRNKGNEIAFIYDEESYHVVSEETTLQMVELFRNYEIDKIGLGSDRYFHNDLSNPLMPDYKLYVFVNLFYLTDKEREDIKNKLRKNSATALFMYGSGLINPDREDILSPSNVTDLTGIKVKMQDDTIVSGKFKFDRKKDLFNRLDMGEIYGDFKRRMSFNASSKMNAIRTSRVNLYPEIYSVDSDGEDFGYLCDSKHPAITYKKQKGYTSIYCASKYLNFDVIREIARNAGCHIYIDSEDVLYVNKNYITFHASTSGLKTIHLKEKASLYELYEEKYYCHNSDEVSFEVLKGETKMFEIKK